MADFLNNNYAADMEEEMEGIESSIQAALEEIAGQDLREFELRNKLEGLYLDKMHMQYRAARMFHPFSEFGKICLEGIEETRKEYEEKVGSLLCLVSDDSIRKFRPLLPEDIMEDIMVDSLQAIGAMRFKDKALYAAGVLAFKIDTDRLSEDLVMRIEWLYVASEFREQGVATMLLGNLLNMCSSLGIEAVTFDFPDNDKWTQGFYSLFDGWNFELESMMTPEFMARAGEYDGKRAAGNLSESAKPIESLSRDELQGVIKSFIGTNALLKQTLSGKLPLNYFDQKLSCFILDENKKGALLLAHRLPSGLVRTEFLVWTKGGGDAMKSLVSHLLVNAGKLDGGDTLVQIPVESIELGEFLDGLFPNQMRSPIMEAALTTPLSDYDLDLESGLDVLVFADEQQPETDEEV